MKKYAEYDKNTLKRLQNIELEMLNDFINICDKHDIDYFALGGTLLGAVRHKGIIPWDDDIDLGFLRKDYEKFVKYAELEYSDKYYFVDYKRNNDYFLPSVRWCKKGTIFVEEAIKKIKSDLGIFLDLYPFDYVSDDEKVHTKQIKCAWLKGKIAILKNVSKPVIYFKGFKAKIVALCCIMGNLILRVLRINHIKLLDKAFSLLNNKKEKTNTICFPFDTKPFACLYSLKDIYPTKKVEFNGLKLRIPFNEDKILTNLFGNYMQIPSEKDRHNHYPYKLEFEVKSKVEE